MPSPSPIGVGTADVEALTSYLTALAQSLAVSVRYLLSEEIYRKDDKATFVPWSNWMVRAATANGPGPEARRIVDILEKLTFQKNLQNLTLLPYERMLSPRSHVLKHSRAWCPACLEEMRGEADRNENGSRRVYEKLVWAVAPVVVCPIHKQLLQTKCRHCSQEQRVLAANSVPGFCNRCIKWLGTSIPCHDATCSADNLWIANAVGEFVAAAPHLEIEQVITTCREAVSQRAIHIAGGSVRALSRSGVSYSRLMAGLRDGTPVPIGLLLSGLHDLGFSIPDLLREGHAGLPKALTSSDESPANAKPHYSLELRRQFLQQELASPQPRSPLKLATSLEYSGTAELWRADRDLYKALVEKTIKPKRLPRAEERIADIKTNARKALEDSLSQSFPKSVKEVAKEMDGPKEATLRVWFPDQCKAIAAKRESYQNSVCEAEVKRALEESPTPSVSEVARRSGQTIAILIKRARELCCQLNERRQNESSSKTELLRQRLTPFLTQDPPMTGADICLELGVSWSELKHSLPELAERIRNRARDYRDRKRILHLMSAFDEVQATVQRLQLNEVVPTAERIAASTKETANDWTLQNDARKKALSDQSQCAKQSTDSRLQGCLTKLKVGAS